jgi:hypothetical protein
MEKVPTNLAEYLLKESEHLKKVYDESAKEISILERYALVATGAIWSWCAANVKSPVFHVLIWVPLIIQILFGLRAWGIYQSMVSTREYLERIEMTVQLPEGLGWGRFLKQHSRGLRVSTSYAFWIALHIITLVVALLYGRRGVAP